MVALQCSALLVAVPAFAQFGSETPGDSGSGDGGIFGGGSSSASQYLGDSICKSCHEDIYNSYINSGHPWKLTRTAGLEPAADTWPHTPVPPLPESLSGWGDVEYVIGNFFWKARFIQRDGYIHTGDAVQWNLATAEFVSYHSGETKAFDCGRCHTTGYSPEGNENGLPGLVGTWNQEGVRCEACHGPAAEHVFTFGAVVPSDGKACSECHYRDADFRMPWQDGFMRHHQQAEDLSHSPHADFACSQCHDPHRSVVYDDGGTIAECTDCHAGNESNNHYVVPGMESVACIDCHMPFMGKSAVAANAYTGDIRGHLFRIMTDAVAAADNVYDGGDGSLFWNQDAAGAAAITLDYACLGCHIDGGSAHVMTLAEAAGAAAGIHTIGEPEPPTPPDPEDPPVDLGDLTIDVTANGLDSFEIVRQTDVVSIDVTVAAGRENTVSADWWLVASTMWGWYYWDPLYGWQPGFYPSMIGYPLSDVPGYNVHDTTLFPGVYTVWFGVFAQDGAMALDTVSIYVLP